MAGVFEHAPFLKGKPSLLKFNDVLIARAGLRRVQFISNTILKMQRNMLMNFIRVSSSFLRISPLLSIFPAIFFIFFFLIRLKQTGCQQMLFDFVPVT